MRNIHSNMSIRKMLEKEAMKQIDEGILPFYTIL